MAVKLVEIGTDHLGRELPKGVYACVTPAEEVVSYKVRWREEDENGVRRQRSKSFGARKLGSLDRALEVALAYAQEVAAIIDADGAITKVDAAAAMTVEDVFQEWVVVRAAGTGARSRSQARRPVPPVTPTSTRVGGAKSAPAAATSTVLWRCAVRPRISPRLFAAA